MNPNSLPESDIAQDYRPFFVIYKDGQINRFLGTDTVPPSTASDAPVLSKDINISTNPSVSARLYLPNNLHQDSPKLPLLIYFHGGGFVIESSQSPTYHNYLNHLASEAFAVIVSVNYRLAPEHPLPAAFDDSWSAVLFSASWLSDHADLSRVFFAGDSAGATIAHHMAVRFGAEPPPGMDLIGSVLVHPYFMGSKPVKEEEDEFGVRFWNFLCPSGIDHPWINPVADGRLGALGGKKVLVFVAEEDALREKGVWYYLELKNSGWSGEVELVESIGEGHVFHLLNPPNDNSKELMAKLVHFINN